MAVIFDGCVTFCLDMNYWCLFSLALALRIGGIRVAGRSVLERFSRQNGVQN